MAMGRLEYIPCASRGNLDLKLDTDSSGLGLTGTVEVNSLEISLTGHNFAYRSSLKLMVSRVLLHNTEEHRQTV